MVGGGAGHEQNWPWPPPQPPPDAYYINTVMNIMNRNCYEWGKAPSLEEWYFFSTYLARAGVCTVHVLAWYCLMRIFNVSLVWILNQYFLIGANALYIYFLLNLYYNQLTSFILPLAKCFRIFKDFPKPSFCSANSCSKASWGLQIAFLKPPGNQSTVLRRL